MCNCQLEKIWNRIRKVYHTRWSWLRHSINKPSEYINKESPMTSNSLTKTNTTKVKKGRRWSISLINLLTFKARMTWEYHKEKVNSSLSSTRILIRLYYLIKPKKCSKEHLSKESSIMGVWSLWITLFTWATSDTKTTNSTDLAEWHTQKVSSTKDTGWMATNMDKAKKTCLVETVTLGTTWKTRKKVTDEWAMVMPKSKGMASKFTKENGLKTNSMEEGERYSNWEMATWKCLMVSFKVDLEMDSEHSLKRVLKLG